MYSDNIKIDLKNDIVRVDLHVEDVEYLLGLVSEQEFFTPEKDRVTRNKLELNLGRVFKEIRIKRMK